MHDTGKKYAASIMVEKLGSNPTSPRHKLFKSDSKKNNFFTSLQYRGTQMNDSMSSTKVQSQRVKTGHERTKQMDWGVNPMFKAIQSERQLWPQDVNSMRLRSEKTISKNQEY